MVEDSDIYHYSNLDSAPEIYKKMSAAEQKVYLSLNQETIEQYAEIFEMFDVTGDGSID